MPTTLRNTDILFNDGTTQTSSRGVAKSWVNFNGSAPPILFGSFNVSSVTRTGVGQYRVFFSSAFADNGYAVSGNAGSTGTGFITAAQATTYVDVSSYSPSPGYVDNTPVSVVIHR